MAKRCVEQAFDLVFQSLSSSSSTPLSVQVSTSPSSNHPSSCGRCHALGRPCVHLSLIQPSFPAWQGCLPVPVDWPLLPHPTVTSLSQPVIIYTTVYQMSPWFCQQPGHSYQDLLRRDPYAKDHGFMSKRNCNSTYSELSIL
ncbi:hypothetical protein AMTRI_Chr01g108150 [Amborella trichopoda]